jgi:hypothetical protein
MGPIPPPGQVLPEKRSRVRCFDRTLFAFKHEKTAFYNNYIASMNATFRQAIQSIAAIIKGMGRLVSAHRTRHRQSRDSGHSRRYHRQDPSRSRQGVRREALDGSAVLAVRRDAGRERQLQPGRRVRVEERTRQRERTDERRGHNQSGSRATDCTIATPETATRRVTSERRVGQRTAAANGVRVIRCGFAGEHPRRSAIVGGQLRQELSAGNGTAANARSANSFRKNGA